MNPILASAHRDVLEAKPDTDEGKAKLVEELQSRGRAAVGAKSWMDAKMLYEKALTICPKDKAPLFNANLSLVLKNMGEFEQARQAAQACVDVDPSHIKGLWRLGQALQALSQPNDALVVLEKAKSLDPTNKALIKECEKCSKAAKEMEKLMAQMEIEKAKKAAEEEANKDNSPPPPPPKPVTSTSTSTAAKPVSASSDKMEVDGEDNLFTKSDAVRGYKIVNGKKTSYFHNELSEEAKNLIGDIAPKKLESAPQPAAAPAANGVSSWNQAGTWEERDVTKWATDSLKQQVLSTTFSFPESSPAPGALVTVTKVTKIDGHASVAVARGKKRFIYEYLVKLEWELTHNDLKCHGSLNIPDIDGTIELGEGYEMEGFHVQDASDDSVRPLLDRFVHRGGFKESLNESIDDWVRLFKKTYA